MSAPTFALRLRSLLAPFAALAVLAAIGCSSVRGRRDADPAEVPASLVGFASYLPKVPGRFYYDCSGMLYTLIENAGGFEVLVTQPPGCIKMDIKPYVMNYHVRDGEGDHFFVWGDDANARALELLVPFDRRRAAELRQFDSRRAPFTATKGRRGVLRIEGAPADRSACWPHAPSASADAARLGGP